MSERAQSFDRVAAEYERGRPGYPVAILDLLPLGPDAEVLDLAAGTGKLTRVLVTRYRRVTAVEPLDGMRAILEQVVPEAHSLAGTAQAIPLDDASVDGVFVASALHWFSTDEVIAEIARVLRPGGILAAVWNNLSDPSRLPDAYMDYLKALEPDSPFHVENGHPWTEPLRRGPFRDEQEATVESEQFQTRDAELDYARSLSLIAHRPEEERERIMRDLDALLPAGPFTFPVSVGINWAVRV
jgi:ubiquinone/menaquinone biosynthesis C-methylase UbiE